MAAKWKYIDEIFANEGKRTLESAPFQQWKAANLSWLLPYAAFMHLRALFPSKDFTTWPQQFRRSTPVGLLS